MKNKSFIYFANIDITKSPGVFNKIENTVAVAEKIGFCSKKYIYSRSFKSRLKFLRYLTKCKSDFIFIRFDDLVLPVLFFIMIFLRIKGKKIIIDIPTPRRICLKEIDSSNKKRSYKITRKLVSICLGSWLLIPANKVIQYADESWWFNIGIRNKTIKMGNGILMNSKIPVVDSVWPADELKLIGVAQLASWHGYDRVINALALAKGKHLPYKIIFTIVGDGSERDALESLVKRLGLEDNVLFTGMLTGEDLNNAFKDKHVGVASLGLYRIGLYEASVLKAREYMARGLTVLGAGEDPDIDIDSSYRVLVSNDESVESVLVFLSGFTDRVLPSHYDVRKFAEMNLSLEAKLSKIIDSV